MLTKYRLTLLMVRLAIALLSPFAVAGAPYRLNRATDSALALYVDNAVSVAADAAGDLHLVYTDSTPSSRSWQVYYRSFKDGYWSIPARLSSDRADIRDNRSPQIAFDRATGSLYATWLALSAQSTVRSYMLFVEKIDPEGGEHSPVQAFGYGTTGFPPRVATAPGRVFFVSEERLSGESLVFRARVLMTASNEWVEQRLENSQTERVSHPVLAASADQAVLLWVRTTSQGYDLMVSRMPAAEGAWSEAKPLFRTPAPPEALTADAHGKLISLLWTVRGGGRNSILMQTSSQDGGVTWHDPEVLYSAGANAAATVTAVSDKGFMALLSVSSEEGDRIQMKYSTDGGRSWLPEREIDAIDIGPGKDSTRAQRPAIVWRSPGIVFLAWEEWKSDGPTLLFKSGSLQNLAASPRRSILGIKDQPRDRFPYFPQLWAAGSKVYVTYGSKRRPQSVIGRTSSSDLHIVELPSAAAAARPPQPVRKK